MRNFLKVMRRTFCIVFGFMILFSLLKFNDNSIYNYYSFTLLFCTFLIIDQISFKNK